MKLEDIDFPKLVDGCRVMSKRLSGTPHIYDVINECLFGTHDTIQPVSIQAFIMLEEMGYSAQDLFND